jgi:hypothetical protein
MTTLPKRANSAGILFLVSFAAPYDDPRRPQTAIAKKKRGPDKAETLGLSPSAPGGRREFREIH